jgi:hypothetical protein
VELKCLYQWSLLLPIRLITQTNHRLAMNQNLVGYNIILPSLLKSPSQICVVNNTTMALIANFCEVEMNYINLLRVA